MRFKKISITKSPIELLLKATQEHDAGTKSQFKTNLELLYRFRVFKPFLDLCATLSKEGRLTFIVKLKKNYDLDAGNCRTVDAIGFDHLLNRFRQDKKYTITLKEISGYVIIHEIGHLVEKEIAVDLAEFSQAIKLDFQNAHLPKALLFTIKRVLFDEVKNYPANQQLSEVFTRFFELLARSKDIAGMAASDGYYVKDFYQSFPTTKALIEERIFKKLSQAIDSGVAALSESYILKEEDITHKWSKGKVSSLHLEAEKPSWSSQHKSIHN